MNRNLSLGSGAAFAALMLSGSVAHAHINMVAPLVGRQGDQKAKPCEGKPRGQVYTFEPGAIITLGVEETVKHDGYFRIAFDNDGEDGFKTPVSIDPINENRVSTKTKCMTDPNDKCGKSDFCNVVSSTGATVLWDDIDPHLGGDSAGKYMWTIQLPNMECENCTIQVLQIMEDPALGFHGPFDGNNDIYYRCIDIKLKKGAGTSGPGNAAGSAVKVGTPNSKFPNANINCLTAAPAGDAGVPTSDAGTTADAGASNDASTAPSTGGAAGGTTGSGGGTTAGTGSAGGGTPGAGGGTTGGSALTDGGTVGTGSTPGGAAGTAGATAGAGGVAGGTPVGPTATDDDEGGCSVAFGSGRRSGLAIALTVLATLLATRRRRRVA